MKFLMTVCSSKDLVKNCESKELFLDLPLQRFHDKRQQIFYIQQSNEERVGTFSSSNRLNDIIPPVCDKLINENEASMKMILKTKILDPVLAKCDNFTTLT